LLISRGQSRIGGMRDHFQISSVVSADLDSVWAHCSSMKGVSRELWPLIRMTYPAGAESLVAKPFVPGQVLFRSRLLLLGFLPVDQSDLTLVELTPGRRFLERSQMATQRLWEHERLLEPAEGGTRVTDRLRWRGRFPGASAMYGLAVPILFRWRHRRLREMFG
jgi:ligand-binding SRPBCC domain-containing protein